MTEDKPIRTIIKEKDVKSWSLDYFQEFFKFYERFYPEGDDKPFRVCYEVVNAMESERSDNEFIDDMLSRIDTPWIDEKHFNRSFNMRLNVLNKIVMHTIEKNPSLITKEMVVAQKKKRGFEWMSKIYNNDGTIMELNAEINRAITEFDNSRLAAPSDVLVQAMSKVADLYNKLAISITDKDLDKLKVMEKINALQKLSYIHTTAKKFKPNLNFIKINTKTANAEELENALLDFANDSEVDEDENGKKNT